jgi:DNA polymerase III epsilon subunit-like protein
VLVVGIDIETTGTLATPGARLVQVGAAAFADRADRWFSSLVSHPGAELGIDPDAMAVHNIPLDVIQQAPPAHEVDDELAAWLADRGATEANPAVAVGWNVASFDLVFIAESLPHTRELLARRSIDLNAVCMALSDLPDSSDFATVKSEAKRWAATRLERAGLGNRPHDACWDAAEAVLVLDWIRSRTTFMV